MQTIAKVILGIGGVMLAIGIAFFGALIYVGWMRRRIKS